LELRAKLVVLGTPIGRYDHPAFGGNPHQEHKSAWLEEDFEALGYKTHRIGEPKHGVNSLIAWKAV